MLKIITLSVLLIAVQNNSHAQTITNTVWKSYFGAPINDTATLTIRNDSSSITNSHGMTVVMSTVHVSNDTISIVDVAGPIKCQQDATGIYSYTISGDKLILHVVSDDCDGRANSLSDRQWMKVSK